MDYSSKYHWVSGSAVKGKYHKELASEWGVRLIHFFAGQKPHVYGVLYFANILIFSIIYCLTPGGFKQEIGLGVALYFSVVTATTLGYGDITPVLTDSAMPMLVSLQVLIGISLIGLFLNSLSYRLSEQKEKVVQAIEESIKEEQISKALMMLRPVLGPGLRTLAQLYKFTARNEAPEYDVRPKEFLNEDFARQINQMVYYNVHKYANHTAPMHKVFIDENNKFLAGLDKYLVTFSHSLPVSILVMLTNLGQHRYFTIAEMYRASHLYVLEQGGKNYPEDFPLPGGNFDQINQDVILDFISQFLTVIEEIDKRNPTDPVVMTVSLRNNILPGVGAGLYPTP